mmetsp:Transcript_32343/g.71527  ORF Transcript_32343/g.71527 Transcript_32343/m.71527 type:complete len:193 (-) Transcript_32343:499-1077(-)|eukprot:CAMPEP_0202893996 /NCGR_PEP_ID=MMETSP1392-20130828/3466_1 /ASSEMBLY_ACC=CAM_ASM_000868 /TAXON_ID=225041 /ORGANISM="Chlamydomonas chlamydogama, Strain SAG 11-48b" /LENGTH=192 /DNA_ID=CAMNT_0049578523 /DNA_START=36 /DNA_END=614 /DNA_ORIENTATION=-
MAASLRLQQSHLRLIRSGARFLNPPHIVHTLTSLPRKPSFANRCPHNYTKCSAVEDEPSPSGGDTDYSKVAARFNQLLTRPSITGRELRELVFQKWGRTYDVRLQKLGSKIYLQVMWRFLEQQSFPLTEVEYMQQLDAVAEYLTEWGVVDTVKQGIASARPKGPGYTGGGNARCVSIPLDVDLTGARKAEWN